MDTYPGNSAAGMIQEMMTHLKEEDLEVTFPMESVYFNEELLETIELLDCMYLIKGEAYSTLVAKATEPDIVFEAGEEGREAADLVTSWNTWKKNRRFVVSRVLKDDEDHAQLSFLEGEKYT